jgi:hypothetical protein
MAPRLVWAVDTAGARYFVDAHDGTVVDRLRLGRSMTGGTAPSGTAKTAPRDAALRAAAVTTGPVTGPMTRKTYKAQGSALPGQLYYDSGARIGSDDPETLTLDTNMSTVMNTFYNDFGRVSYDNGWLGGATAIASSTYIDPESPDESNAFWNGTQFAFSRGLVTLDIVAHEFTHAVDQYSANLTYRGQSGALSESFADIFGSYVNSQAKNQDVWLLGAGTAIAGACGGLRDISNPEACARPGNPAPGTTANWQNTCADEGGVHINSGIVSHAYYLVATRIGRASAAKIFYRTLAHYLSSGSGLEDTATAANSAAWDLFASEDPDTYHVVCEPECDAVNGGFADVGLGAGWAPPALNCDDQAKQAGREAFAPTLANFVGCYTDSGQRQLPNRLLSSGATVSSCSYAARQAGYAYAGLQYGGECWAGNQLGGTRVSDDQCSATCTADSHEKCGGTWLNSIWTTGAPTAAAPLTCQDVKSASGGGLSDGEYQLHVRGAPVSVYCANMAGNPVEYLTLKNTGGNANYSLTGSAPNTSPGGVRTSFTRVRFHPDTLTVDLNDFTFSTNNGGWASYGNTRLTNTPYATGGDCAGGGSTTGNANVDLTGTPFTVAPNQFTSSGWAAAGSASYSAENQVVNLTGGGYCGSEQPASGALQLALLRSCQDVKTTGASADGEYLLWAGGKMASVYCRGMAGTPSEYLTLRSTGGNSNYSSTGAAGNTSPGGVRTSFTRVRFHPETMVVDLDDFTFTTNNGGWATYGSRKLVDTPYATAGDCVGSGSQTGTANVDLTGTPFAVVSNQFAPSGWAAAGTATYSAQNQVVNLTGGGYCGSEQPTSAALHVGYAGATF